MFHRWAAVLLCVQAAIAGRYDAQILNSGSKAALVASAKRAALSNPFHTSAAKMQGGKYPFAGVYIGNRMVLTAAHCLEIEGVKPYGLTAQFTTSNGRGGDRILDTVKALNWQYVKKFEVGGQDYGVMILERDPVGVTPAPLWTQSGALPSRQGMVISTVAPIDCESYNGLATRVQSIGFENPGKHAIYTELISGSELPAAMRSYLDLPSHTVLSAVMHEDARYQTISDAPHGKTRAGDSGSPVFARIGGQYQLVGLVSGGYEAAEGVPGRDLAELYAPFYAHYYGGPNSVAGCCKRALEEQIALEKKRIVQLENGETGTLHEPGLSRSSRKGHGVEKGQRFKNMSQKYSIVSRGGKKKQHRGKHMAASENMPVTLEEARHRLSSLMNGLGRFSGA